MLCFKFDLNSYRMRSGFQSVIILCVIMFCVTWHLVFSASSLPQGHFRIYVSFMPSGCYVFDFRVRGLYALSLPFTVIRVTLFPLQNLFLILLKYLHRLILYAIFGVLKHIIGSRKHSINTQAYVEYDQFYSNVGI